MTELSQEPPALPECSRCGHRPHAGDAGGRCSRCGSFLRGNQVALKHGGRRMQLSGGTVLDLAEQKALAEAVAADLGDDLSAVQAELVRDFCFAAVLRQRLAEYLAVNGPRTANNAKRPAFDQYLAVSGRVERLAKLIGTQRCGRRVRSVEDAIQKQRRKSA